MPKPAAVTAFDVLLGAAALSPAPVCVLVGDAGFLMHETRRALLEQLAGHGSGKDGPDGKDAGADWKDAVEILDGDAELRDVLDALSARSLFGGDRRFVVVEDADGFVKDRRAGTRGLRRPAVRRRDARARGPLVARRTRGSPKPWLQSGLTISCQTPDRGAGAHRVQPPARRRGSSPWRSATSSASSRRTAVELLIDLLPSEAGRAVSGGRPAGAVGRRRRSTPTSCGRTSAAGARGKRGT